MRLLAARFDLVAVPFAPVVKTAQVALLLEDRAANAAEVDDDGGCVGANSDVYADASPLDAEGALGVVERGEVEGVGHATARCADARAGRVDGGDRDVVAGEQRLDAVG